MHSTQTSLHRLIEYFYMDIHNGQVAGMVALDLRKAFDTVDHSILLDKLGHYGVAGTSLMWFRSYLTGRSQTACVNGSLSDPLTIKTGVPQGSILGPLLFLVYLNDLPGCLTKCSVNMYADDTAIYFSAPSTQQVTIALQDDLERVNTWLCANRLSLHAGKTSSMLVTTRQRRKHLDGQLALVLGDTPLEQVSSCCYLGVTIDQNLDFAEHIDKVARKASRALGALKRASRYIHQDTRATMYNTLVLPHLDYCCTLWGNSGKNKIQRLQKIQNRGMRIVLQSHPRTHIKDMLGELRWLSVKQRILFLNCVFIFKILNGLTPSYLTPLLSQTTHQHRSRASTLNNLFVQRAHPRSLTTTGTALWNSLPVCIRSLPKLTSFKGACAKHIALSFDPI